MSVVFVLVFVAISMAGAFLLAFIWSVKNGQYEDTYTPSVRMLFDDVAIKERSDQSQLAETENAKTETGEGKTGNGEISISQLQANNFRHSKP
jgi:cbb3-type cytochrome oxidase maturation protein